MIDLVQIPPILGVVGLIVAFVIYLLIIKYPGGEGKAAKIAKDIHDGAMVFMRKEYSILGVFLVFIAILLFVAFDTWHTSVAFVVGAFSSAVAGYIGMLTATKANVRTTIAARDKGASEALTVAFYGGSVMGLAVASMGLLGLGGLYYFFGAEHAEAIHGFGMGGSTVALFSRVGGGIFTKSADVGAD